MHTRGELNMPINVVHSNENLSRLLSIKLNVFKRTLKDLESYEREAEQQLKHIQSMDQSDEAGVKKQYQVYDETKRMLPECQQRLVSVRTDLEKFIADYSDKLDHCLTNEARNLLK
jgi:hypothetical protein